MSTKAELYTLYSLVVVRKPNYISKTVFAKVSFPLIMIGELMTGYNQVAPE